MAFWMNIHGCQQHPKVAIYVIKQLKNDSFFRNCIRHYVKDTGLMSPYDKTITNITYLELAHDQFLG